MRREDTTIDKQKRHRFSAKALILGDADRTFVQLLRYIVVGTAGFWVDFGALALCVEALGMDELASATLAFLLGLAVNYGLGRVWIFHKSRFARRGAELAVFLLIGLVALGLNNGVIWLFRDVLAPARALGDWLAPDKYYLIGKLVSMTATFLWNFIARKKFLYLD